MIPCTTPRPSGHIPGHGFLEGGRSGRRASLDLEDDDAIRSGERGLRGRVERFAIELVASHDSGQRFADPQVGIQELHLDGLTFSEGDDRSGVNFVAPIRVRRVDNRDRDRLRGAVVVGSHHHARRKTVITESRSSHRNDNKDTTAVCRLASEPRVTPIIKVTGRRVRDRCVDLIGADAVQPHLVSGVPAQPLLGLMLAPIAAEPSRSRRASIARAAFTHERAHRRLRRLSPDASTLANDQQRRALGFGRMSGSRV
jgi:hypothetical protein